MKILYFDICFNKSYIVLDIDNKTIEAKIIESDDRNYHSAYLIPSIRDILSAHKLFVKDLDAIGINAGPGSFTGIRTAAAAARVMCSQFDIKLVCVSSLQILSYLNKQNTDTQVILDARRNKVYFGEYNRGVEITPPILKDKEALIPVLKKGCTLVTDASICGFLRENGITSINFEETNDNLGLYGMETVKHKIKNAPQDEDFSWKKAKPAYLQQPSISKPKEKNNV